jgi:hypothetical protein
MSKTARGRGRPELQPGTVLVVGSSGKGTTCRMLAEMARGAGLQPVLAADDDRHRPGVGGALITRAGAGRVPDSPRSIALIDAAASALPDLLRQVPHPAAVVCTNILRGQPDSYTGAEAVTARLERAIRSLPASTTLVLNADDPRVAGLAADLPNPRVFFGISDRVQGRMRPDPTAEAHDCPRCGGRLSYTCVYYAHLGHWACDGCGRDRPEPHVVVTKVSLAGSTSSRLQVAADSVKAVLDVPLPGMYNAYNALAAVAVARHLGLPAWSLRAIETVSPGPMRMERANVAGRVVHLAVATNAIGYTEVLRAILGDGEPRRMLLGLGAGQGPPQDISWIWDVDFESLAGLVPAPIVSGNRAGDLGVRLRYAGWLGDAPSRGDSAGVRIEPDPIRAARLAIDGTPPGQPLWIVSTPAALAEIRRWLRQHDFSRDPEAQQPGQVRTSRVSVVRAAIQLSGPRLAGSRPPRPKLSGPQPSGPPRSAAQAAASLPIGPRQDRRRRRGWRSARQSGQAGAAR